MRHMQCSTYTEDGVLEGHTTMDSTLCGATVTAACLLGVTGTRPNPMPKSRPTRPSTLAESLLDAVATRRENTFGGESGVVARATRT